MRSLPRPPQRAYVAVETLLVKLRARRETRQSIARCYDENHLAVLKLIDRLKEADASHISTEMEDLLHFPARHLGIHLSDLMKT
jgi:hypothetical protein